MSRGYSTSSTTNCNDFDENEEKNEKMGKIGSTQRVYPYMECARYEVRPFQMKRNFVHFADFCSPRRILQSEMLE